MAATAFIKGVRISPRKVSPVAALIRGRSVNDALTILEHTPRRSADSIKKALLSAKANAEHNHNYKPDSLFISQLSVTAGPRFRRYRAAWRGTARKYQRQTSHIKIVVDGEKRIAKKQTSEANKETKK